MIIPSYAPTYPSIPPISEQEMTPLVIALIAKNEEYAGMILVLREQVQILNPNRYSALFMRLGHGQAQTRIRLAKYG